ncbi:DrmB family protein [Neobacillus sp. NPDC093182]|uniref:DrmB family protein n=1 Tax=Neobacillus sp. NPDC093182 TaxID=3364297 RepID=UPI003825F7C3
MKKPIGEIRPSQFVSTYGPGAIIDLPDYSIILAGIDYWNLADTKKIDEPRLRKRLRVNSIRSLPTKTKGDIPTIPSFRYPTYYVCPNCRKLAPFYKFTQKTDGSIFCNNNKDNANCENVKAFPVRYLSACTGGHLNDFHWNSFVHQKNRSCKETNRLYLRDAAAEGKLEDVQIVECKACDTRRPLSDAFDKSQKALPACLGRRPWLGKNKEEECGKEQRIILRGASNIYFPVIEGVLSIPKETQSPVVEVLEGLSDRISMINTYEKLKLMLDMNVFPELNQFSHEEIWRAITNSKEEEEINHDDLLLPEWKVLSSNQKIKEENNLFEMEPQPLTGQYEHEISNLVMVRRLREVRVIRNFTRINPAPDVTSQAFTEGDEADVGFASLSSGNLDWLPGVETYGEGIFFAVNEDYLREWEKRDPVKEYEKNLEHVFNQYYEERRIKPDYRPPFPGVRYVMLHSLAHILIRHLCMHSGYSASSLRERIYSRKSPEKKDSMAGVLIYTASPDSEGSLGGLVELGNSEKFSSILWEALEEARLCSADPLCSDYEPHHHRDLNGACCHSCLLIAETSCESTNRYLDRSLLVETVSNQNLNFFLRKS